MIRYLASCMVAGFFLLSAPSAHATLVFEATLTGVSENPPNVSPATGSLSLLLNEVTNVATISFAFSGLTGPTTAAHIHVAPAGLNGPVILPLTLPLGVMSGIVAAADYAFPAANLADLQAGGLYVNIHTVQFPGGEIRGQLQAAAVDAPATLALLLPGLVLFRRRRL